MSDENQAQVRKILSIVKDPLGCYILSRCHICFGDKYLEEVKSYLSKKKHRVSPATEQEVLDNMDILGWLNLMYQKWYAAFDGALERVNRSYVDILRDARHNLSHEDNTNDFTDMDVIHVANTATRLLEAIGAKEEAKGTREIAQELPIYSEREQKTTEKSTSANNLQQPPADSLNGQQHQSEFAGAAATLIEDKEETNATPPDKREKRSMSQSHESERTSHADDAIQQLIRQHQEMMRHMQRQQASHQKTTASANADVIQLLFRQNQDFMQHMQQMQASQPAASTNADVIQQLIPLIRQNQALMQQASQSPASASDDAVQQLIRQNQAFMQHMQQQQQMQTSQPIININPNISPNISPSISANAGDQVAYAPPAPATVIAERNNAAFVVGVIAGLFGVLGIAHIFNHKAGRGLVYLFVGTVCYWIFLLLLLSALVNIGSSLWIAAIAIHLAIIWQHAKRGASSASANQAGEP